MKLGDGFSRVLRKVQKIKQKRSSKMYYFGRNGSLTLFEQKRNTFFFLENIISKRKTLYMIYFLCSSHVEVILFDFKC